MMSALQVNVGLEFGRSSDFRLAVDIAFASQGITALFGPSGCGKSTLLRIIAGLEATARGDVSFNGINWQSERDFMPPWQRGIGFVFQDGRLFPHLDVAGNLAYAAQRSVGIKSNISFNKIVDALDLAPLLMRTVQSLSGGEKQRVAIGRALLTKPSLILMDEPLSALDMKRRSSILPLIRRLPELFGLPVIYVTHAINEVAQIADHIVLMQDGSIQATGAIDTIFENAALDHLTGRFDAGVVVEASVVAHDLAFQMTGLRCQGHELTLPLVPVEIGEVIRLRIRARDVALATEVPRGLSIRNVLPVEIVSISAEPETAFAEVVLAFGAKKLRARITRASIAELNLIPGRAVYALVKSIAFDKRGLSNP